MFHMTALTTRSSLTGPWSALSMSIKKIRKTISVTSHLGQQDCETLRIPHCLDNRLTVNCEILATCSSTYNPVHTSQEAHSISIK
jgi:hypothetical protein